MKRILCCLAASLLAASPALAAKPAQPLTLVEAQRIALHNHPEIKARDLDVKAAEMEIEAQRAAYYPQVSAAAVQAFAGPDTRIAADGALNNPTVYQRGSVGLEASQMITDFGRTDARVEAAKSAYRAQKQLGNATRADVLLAVTRAYFDTLRAQALLQVAQDTLKTRQTLLDQVSSLHQVQMRSDLDLSIAKQGVDDANLLMLRARNGRDAAMAELSEALGYSDTHLFRLAPEDKAHPLAVSLDGALTAAMSGNPKLAALQAEAEAAKRQAEAAAREFYPTLSAVGFAGATPIHGAGANIAPNYGAGGINFTIPLYTGGRRSADADKAEAQAQAADMGVVLERNRLVRDIRLAYDDAVTAYNNIAVTRQMEKNAKESLVLTQARYNIGKSSIVDLSTAQLAETSAAVSAADAAYQYHIRKAVLDYAMGKFTVRGATR